MFENFDFSLLDDPDFKEDAVREEIIVPVLKRLGYQASGTTRIQRSKPLRHPFVHIGTRKHPVNIVPDYTLWHDDKPILILEAKKPSEEILHSQHVEQAYSYAIHPEIRCKHFALCNGKQIAIFHVAETAPSRSISLNTYFDSAERSTLCKRVVTSICSRIVTHPRSNSYGSPRISHRDETAGASSHAL